MEILETNLEVLKSYLRKLLQPQHEHIITLPNIDESPSTIDGKQFKLLASYELCASWDLWTLLDGSPMILSEQIILR